MCGRTFSLVGLHITKQTLECCAIFCAMVGVGFLSISICSNQWLETCDRVYLGDLEQFKCHKHERIMEATRSDQPVTVTSWMSGLWQVCTVYSKSNWTSAFLLKLWIEQRRQLFELPEPEKETDCIEIPPVRIVEYQGTFPPPPAFDLTEFSAANEDNEDQCHAILYSQQPEGRDEGNAVTFEVLRKVTRSSPLYIITLVLLIVGAPFTIIGYKNNDRNIIFGAVAYILAGMMCALAIILYISAINDEASHARKKGVEEEEQRFRYHYRWGFYLGASSFVFSQITAVINVSLYLQRYRGSIEDMAKIIPGIGRKAKEAGIELGQDDPLQQVNEELNL